MKLKETARKHYMEDGYGCAAAVLLCGRDALPLPVSEDEIILMNGFRGGMGCGGVCGALSGSIAVLSKKYKDREDIKEICGGFVEAFRAGMGCGSVNCVDLKQKHHAPDDQPTRCIAAVELACDLLEAYMAKLDGKAEAAEPAACTLTPEQLKSVKAEGFLHNKGTNRFNGRVITRNGRLTIAEWNKIGEAAQKYGDGYLMATTRLTVEASGIEFENIPAFQACLAEEGLTTGGTGSRVRPVVSCKGTTCVYGLYDTFGLSEKIHERFYVGMHNVSLPHKFKIALGGCPNNCVKPNLNDLGIIGARIPAYDAQACKGCKKCQMESTCPMKAAKVVDGKLVIDKEICNNCGRCIGKCPFHCADEGTYGWRITIGGRWGKKVAHGRMLNKLFTSEQEVMDMVEKAILLFRSEGLSGERFADTITRIGFEKAESMLLSDDLLKRRDEILGISVTGGATC